MTGNKGGGRLGQHRRGEAGLQGTTSQAPTNHMSAFFHTNRAARASLPFCPRLT